MPPRSPPFSAAPSPRPPLALPLRQHRRGLPSCPDIVFPGRKKVIFVHGRFWHRQHGCKPARVLAPPIRPNRRARYCDLAGVGEDGGSRSYGNVKQKTWRA
ncbi:MAG: hypothetical protein K2X44_08010 [Magnetospirillum sp.]|nr:hypothetical protein [Magnetospirillum sp.]